MAASTSSRQATCASCPPRSASSSIGGCSCRFADEDAMTSLVLSKVLLLAEDEKIIDELILSQLRRPG